LAKHLITGGTGFIGREVARQLRALGHEVVCFDLKPDEARIAGLNVTIAQGDLGEWDAVDRVIEEHRPDVVFHFGGMLSVPSEADPVASFNANALGTMNVLGAAHRHGVKQVVYSSTMVTYGKGIEGQTIDEATLQRPNLFYGATKVFGEHAGLWFARKHGLDFRGIRYPGIVGPGVQTPGVAQYNAWMVESAIRGEPFSVWVREDTRHAILYYKDAAAAAIQLSGAPAEALSGAVYVVTSGHPSPSAGELADAVRRQIPDADISFGPDPERQRVLDDVERPIDDSAARNDWGFSPQFGLDEMVADMRETVET